MTWMQWTLVVVALALAGPLISLARGDTQLGGSWRTASRESAGLAPDPAAAPEAVLQAYAARTFGMRGAVAVHSWIAAKRAGAEAYTVYEVIGWRRYRGLPVLSAQQQVPDRHWFGNRPRLLVDLRGERAEALISEVEAAVAAYPWAERYRMWPGPNSNTFTAYVARRVPGLGLELPTTAIGKDYLGDSLWAPAPSGTGYQVSLYGVFGILAARREGLEVNLLGFTFGVDPLPLAVKMPGVGRLGFPARGANAAPTAASSPAP